MIDTSIPIVTSDPLLNNAEAEWFREQFEKLAEQNGFPVAQPITIEQTPSHQSTLDRKSPSHRRTVSM